MIDIEERINNMFSEELDSAVGDFRDLAFTYSAFRGATDKLTDNDNVSPKTVRRTGL